LLLWPGISSKKGLQSIAFVRETRPLIVVYLQLPRIFQNHLSLS